MSLYSVHHFYVHLHGNFLMFGIKYIWFEKIWKLNENHVLALVVLIIINGMSVVKVCECQKYMHTNSRKYCSYYEFPSILSLN